MAHDIFISYSTKDTEVADALCAFMEERGLSCWYAPRNIRPGDDWANSIINAIDVARVMILIFTKDSNVSKQVMREVDYAVHTGTAIVPLRLSQDKPAESMRYYLAGLNWIEAIGKNQDKSFAELYSTCRDIIEHGPIDVIPAGAGFGSSGKVSARNKQNKKKTAIIAAVLAVVVLAATGLALHFAKPETGTPTGVDMSDGLGESSNTYTSGNSQGNLKNGGYLAYDGEWYYFTTDEGLFRMKPDGSSKNLIHDKPGGYISMHDDNLYYYASSYFASNDYADNFYSYIAKIKIDGSNVTAEKLEETFAVRDMRVINDRIYFRDSSEEALYSDSLDGGDLKKENDLTGSDYFFCMDDKYVYCSYDSSKDKSGLYRMKIGSDDKELLLDHDMGEMTAADGRIYFNDLSAAAFSFYDIASGEHKTITKAGIYLDDFVVSGKYAYGRINESGSSAADLIRVNIEDGSYETFIEGACYGINLSGNKLRYHDIDADHEYIVDLDGSNRIEL